MGLSTPGIAPADAIKPIADVGNKLLDKDNGIE